MIYFICLLDLVDVKRKGWEHLTDGEKIKKHWTNGPHQKSIKEVKE